MQTGSEGDAHVRSGAMNRDSFYTSFWTDAKLNVLGWALTTCIAAMNIGEGDMSLSPILHSWTVMLFL